MPDDATQLPPAGQPAMALPPVPARGYPAPEPPRVPGFEVMEVLGRGGMGVVYRARQTSLNRVVALKMVLAGDRADPATLVRFLAEAEAAAAVRHPNVVEVYQFGEHAGQPFLALEYLPGDSLAARLKAGGRMAPAAAAGLVAAVARGVQAAHEQGIVHRDLKPANILFTAAGEPKVTDFGIAKRGTGGDLTRTLAVIGTPAYMAPEQAAGRAKFVSPRADVHALGAVLYECLTGSKPFDDPDTLVVLRQVAEQPPVPPRQLLPSLPRDLELICLKCLEKEPADRYPTAAELADDLGRFLRGEPVSVRPPGRAERAARWARRNPASAAAYALGAVALALGGVGLVVGGLWREAESARRDAVTARQDAETTRDQLDRVAYLRTVDLAFREYLAGRAPNARRLLADCRADLRGWEWGHVHRLCHEETATIAAAPDWVYALAVSPDGTRLATGCRFLDDVPDPARAVRVWDVATGKVVAELGGHENTVHAVDFGPDGTRLVSAGRASRSHPGRALVWDLAARRVLFEVPLPRDHPSPVAAYSPAGDLIAASGPGGTVTLWRAADGSPVGSLAGHTDAVVAVAFSPDGRRLASGSRDGSAAVWDVASRRPAGPVVRHPAAVWAVALSPDGARLLAGSLDRTARVWRVADGSELLTLTGHERSVVGAAFAPDGSTIATAGGDFTARVWDAATGREVRALRGHADSVLQVRYLPGGRLATSGKDGTVRVWSPPARPAVVTLRGHTSFVEAAAADPRSGWVLTGGVDGTARLWSAETGALIRTVPGHATGVTAVGLGPAVATTGDAAGVVRVWSGGGEVRAIPAHAGWVSGVAVSADGRRVVSAGGSEVKVWDAAGVLVREWSVAPAGVTALGLGADPDRVAVGLSDGSVRVWDAGGERPGPFRPEGPVGRVQCVAVGPDGARVAAGTGDGSVRVWDTRSGRAVGMTFHGEPVTAVGWSPDGRRVAAGSDSGTVKVADADTGREAISLPGHVGPVRAVGFDPAGAWLTAVAASDSRIGFDVAVRSWAGGPP